jgi:phage repressor protein C with HTH and peptisase S24 domain
MDIFESWIFEFRALVDAEIKEAGGKSSDGYRAVSTKTGIGYDYIYQIYKGQPKNSPKRPTADVMNTLRRVYGGNKPVIGEIFKSTEISLVNNPDYPAIRRVRFKLSAGASGFAVEYDQGEGVPMVFGSAWYAKRGLTPDKLFAVSVSNGSMEPGLHHGDTVVVNTESIDPKDGYVFAVNYEGELVIKRMIRDAGDWWLSSDNVDQRRYPRKLCGEGVFLIGEIVQKQSERI